MPRFIEDLGLWAPWILLALFLAGSFLMIWRLEVMTGRGMEGTVLGTLVMPYCSGRVISSLSLCSAQAGVRDERLW